MSTLHYNPPSPIFTLTVKRSSRFVFFLFFSVNDVKRGDRHATSFGHMLSLKKSTPAQCNSSESPPHAVDFHTLMSSAAVNKTPE